MQFVHIFLRNLQQKGQKRSGSTEVPSEDYVLLAEDERLDRFSRQCLAEARAGHPVEPHGLNVLQYQSGSIRCLRKNMYAASLNTLRFICTYNII